jgi:hypothetical protein
VLRGILNPAFDARAERDRRVLDIVRQGDADERAALRAGMAPTAPPAP